MASAMAESMFISMGVFFFHHVVHLIRYSGHVRLGFGSDLLFARIKCAMCFMMGISFYTPLCA